MGSAGSRCFAKRGHVQDPTSLAPESGPPSLASDTWPRHLASSFSSPPLACRRYLDARNGYGKNGTMPNNKCCPKPAAAAVGQAAF
eukprot:6951268-Pyramimonas_sp.AAC.1